MNLRLDVAYDGGPFRGFARQPGQKTVQGELEAALGRLLQVGVTVYAAGRTDAGVHALGQVVSVPGVRVGSDPAELRAALNAMLAPAIAVTACSPAAEGFHARFSARSRTYVYALLNSDTPDPWLAHTTLYHPRALDLDAMNEAAGHLVGEHDFSSFGRVEEGGPACRNLFELRCSRAGRVVRIRARANSFLQQMVRSLVGTLVAVGEGRRDPHEMPAVLEARSRSAAGPVAAPHGLCLVSVEYDDGWSVPVDPLR